MTYSDWRSTPTTLALMVIYLGAASAVFFSPSGIPPVTLTEPISAALAAESPIAYPQNNLPLANTVPEEVMIVAPPVISIVVAPPKPPIIVVPPVITPPVTVAIPEPPKVVVHSVAARLIIPSINVNATIKEMGYTSNGAMAVPANRTDVGWFEPGIKLGAVGSAVIGGHNEWASGAAVFADLHKLAIGDRLMLVDKNGVSTTYIVKRMKSYVPTDDATDIFNSGTGIHLNLITCSGIWNAEADDYSTRLVVFTDKE